MNHPQPQTEKEKRFEALFPEYVGMGEQRSYGKICRKHGIEAPELMRHARQFLWPERLHQLQIKANEETAPAVDPEDPAGSELNRLHLQRLKALQKKAMDYLEGCTFDKPDTALRMLVETMKLQREILGLTKDKTDDLRAILERRIREATEVKGEIDSPQTPEFTFDPTFQTEKLPDGPEGNTSPPSGGDPAE